MLEAITELGYVRNATSGELAAHWRRSGFATWLFHPAATGWYFKRGQQEAHPDRSLRCGPRAADQPGRAGWMNYYGAFYPSALYPLLAPINAYLLRWLRKKHKRLRGRRKAQNAWNRAVRQRPRFFAHLAWVTWIPAVW